MKPLYRSLLGALLAVAGIPVFVALQACIPVPLGDPEKSRVDPDLTGLWAAELEGDPGVALFEPFNRRAWLLTMIGINELDCPDDVAGEGRTDGEWAFYDDLVAQFDAWHEGCTGTDAGPEVLLFKAWRVKLGGQWFMTWEPLGNYDGEDGFADEFWYGMRIDKVDRDHVRLHLLNAEHDAFDVLDEFEDAEEATTPAQIERVLKKARRAVERAVARSVDDKDLYIEDPWLLRRVADESVDDFTDIIEELVSSD